MRNIKPYKKPIYVTKPFFPNLNELKMGLADVWRSQWITNNGQKHEIFENKIKNYLKVPNASLFNNGTTALAVALKSLNLKGEVITTPFTFAATPHVISWNNLEPVFCDINPETLTIDPNKIEKLITPRTSAILGVHVFGIPCDVKKIEKIAKKHNLKVIYDAAHAFGTEINGTGIGNFGDISAFSFHATKLFHTAEGGALTFKNKVLKKKIDLLRNFGIKNEEEVVEIGINGKMNELQAVLGIINLKYIEKERKKREKVKKLYINYLKNTAGIKLFPDMDGVKNSLQYFVVRIDNKIFGRSRDYVYNQLKKFNIFPRKYFYPLCSRYSCYRKLKSSAEKNLPVANLIAKEVLSLPFYGDLTKKNIENISMIIKSLQR